MAPEIGRSVGLDGRALVRGVGCVQEVLDVPENVNLGEEVADEVLEGEEGVGGGDGFFGAHHCHGCGCG